MPPCTRKFAADTAQREKRRFAMRRVLLRPSFNSIWRHDRTEQAHFNSQARHCPGSFLCLDMVPFPICPGRTRAPTRRGIGTRPDIRSRSTIPHGHVVAFHSPFPHRANRANFAIHLFSSRSEAYCILWIYLVSLFRPSGVVWLFPTGKHMAPASRFSGSFSPFFFQFFFFLETPPEKRQAEAGHKLKPTPSREPYLSPSGEAHVPQIAKIGK